MTYADYFADADASPICRLFAADIAAAAMLMIFRRHFRHAVPRCLFHFESQS